MLELALSPPLLLLESEKSPLGPVNQHDVDSVALENLGQVGLNFIHERSH